MLYFKLFVVVILTFIALLIWAAASTFPKIADYHNRTNQQSKVLQVQAR